jgi:ketosteroid isomerase-like protein
VSEANVALFRRFTDTANAPDHHEALLTPILSRDFTIENIVTAVTDKTYYGAAGCLEWLHEMTDAFAEGWHCEVETIIAHSDDFVVARLAMIATGARSGAPLSLRWIDVAWFEDGKLARVAGYAHRHEAFKAVGLEP